MVSRLPVKCEVCGAVTIVRLQLGYIEQHPMRLNCGSCGILITGSVDLTQDDERKVVFQNAHDVGVEIGDYCIQVSPEFITNKVQKLEGGDLPLDFSPYLEAFQHMGEKGAPTATGPPAPRRNCPKSRQSDSQMAIDGLQRTCQGPVRVRRGPLSWTWTNVGGPRGYRCGGVRL